ncbi:DUF2510 domain-containing protein [Streptomyces sp. ME02-6978.2a]|uniref:DUF2510 domain-containing protein n=1 Tax=Streptomyces sp. ME02-6978.2a TaxID=462922 RepID=UPI0039F6D6ED
MTQVTPPGWYPDPGQNSDGPATERWWDGNAWTERIRPAAPAAPGGPPAPGPADAARAEEDTPPSDAVPQDTAPSGPDTTGAPDTGTAGTTDAAPGTPPGLAVPAADAAQAGPADAGPGSGPAAPRWGGPPAPGQEGAFGATAPLPAGGYPGAQPGAYPPPYPGQAGYPAHPAHPAYPTPLPPRRRGLRVGIAVAAAVAVLASIGVGAYVLTKDDGGSGGTSSSAQGPGGDRRGREGGSGGSGGGGPESGRPEAPKIESGSVADPIDGISLPVPDGWYGQQGQIGAQLSSKDTYKCPGDTSKTCTRGGAYSTPALALGTKGGTAEEVAKADIADNAEESYGGDSYGSITSHEVLASKAVTVAGQKGYLVRWKAVTSKGSDGYVQSLAFPSPVSAKQMVVVRFGVDVGQKQSLLDEITEGIKVSKGGGSGQDV